MPPLPAALVAAAVAVLAWRARTLTAGGAVAAAIVGTLILVGTGWVGGAVLAAFFVSSSAVGRLAPAPMALDPKGERRDPRQVAANGGPAAIGALVALHSPTLGLWIVTGSLAAATADTWATSLGARSWRQPRRLLFGATVPVGTSGGMTAAGTVAALGGAALVGGVAAIIGNAPALAPLGTLVGFAGMAADSALGALGQARYHCPVCDAASEWPVHRCGARTARKGGLAWLDNDGVNLAATSFAALLAAAAWRCWSR